MTNERPQFEEMNNSKKNLDLGEVINNAFEIYKKTALMGGLAFMALMFFLVIFSFMAVGFFTDTEKLPELMKDFNPDNLSLNGTLIYIGVIVTFTVLVSPFIAGMLKMAHDADTNEEVTFSSIFYYVNSSKFLDIVLATTIISLFSVGLNMLLKFVLPATFAGILGFIISYSISILTFITIPLIIFKSLNFIDAIKTSCKTLFNHFFIVLLLMIIGGLASAVGLIAFCIGIFFTIPFVYAIQYSIYKKLN
jgi:hypothetical protein